MSLIQIAAGTPPNPFRSGLREIEFRERLLCSLWYDDLWQELIRQLGPDRTQLVGTPDMSRNPTKRLNRQLAACYAPPPLVAGMPEGLAEALGDWSGPSLIDDYAAAGGAPMPSKLAEVQAQALLYALTCNESAVILAWADDAGRVIPHLGMPSRIRGIENSRNPGQPGAFAWLRPTEIGGESTWAWDVWDLRGGTPRYYVSTAMADDDDAFFAAAPKHQVLPELAREGDAYPWRDLDSRPIIPASILHRAPHAGLWDRSSGGELSQATVTLSVLLTHWGHGLKDGCWVRPYVLGASLTTGQVAKTPPSTPGAQAVNSVPNDLSSLLEFEADPRAKQMMIGQFNPAFSPKEILDAILAWEQALWSQILSIDYSSTGGDPLARLAEVREAYIRSLYPACREHDARCLQVAAIVARRFGGLPIAAFRPAISYREEIKPKVAPPEPPKTGAENG